MNQGNLGNRYLEGISYAAANTTQQRTLIAGKRIREWIGVIQRLRAILGGTCALHIRCGVDVGSHHANFVIFFVEAMQHDVS